MLIFFLIFPKKKHNYVVGTHEEHLSEALLTSIHNICFCGEIKKKYFHLPHMHFHVSHNIWRLLLLGVMTINKNKRAMMAMHCSP